MINEIEINGETYIKKSELSGEVVASETRIVVLHRGWNIIGKVSEKDDTTFIKNASVIRDWGTTEGLGELAEKGVLPDTKLDKCPDITIKTENVIYTMNCNQSNW